MRRTAVLGLVLVAGVAVATETPPAGGGGYRIEPVPSGVTGLRARFDEAQLALLEKLNRADLAHLARLEQIVVPMRWDGGDLALSPLPREYAGTEGHPKALVVHQPAQVFGAYEEGRLVRWGPVSSGRRDRPTPSGLFHLNWRSRGRHSTVDPRWYMPWYFNFENWRGLAFHQYDLPGRPASYACIRLLERDARWLFAWGEGWTLDASGREVLEHGTPVLIVGSYDFDAEPPWRSLEWLAQGGELPAGADEGVGAPAPGRGAAQGRAEKR
jgi:hypothetical protein